MNCTEAEKHCPILGLLSLIAKKWTLIIVKTIGEGAHTYSEIEKRATDINPSILSNRLKELQDFGFIEKKIVSENPVKIEYSLTEKGISFSKELKGLMVWAKEWM